MCLLAHYHKYNIGNNIAANKCVLFPGDVTIFDAVMLIENSDTCGTSPQFTLTCISTGGPATTVTWTRDAEKMSLKELRLC